VPKTTKKTTQPAESVGPKSSEFGHGKSMSPLTFAVSNLTLITAYLVWVGFKSQHTYFMNFGVSAAIEEVSVIGTVIRSVGALASFGWDWLLMVSFAGSIVFMGVFILREFKSPSWWANPTIKSVASFLIWLGVMMGGAMLGSRKGRMDADQKKNHPNPTDWVFLHLKTNPENQFSAELLESNKNHALIRIFQNKDFLVVFSASLKRTFLLQTKDVAEADSAEIDAQKGY
jgi:hypothetical protein